MKRKISSTLAVTLIASNMQSLSFAEGNENLKELPKPDSTVIVLWKVLILIIWKYR